MNILSVISSTKLKEINIKGFNGFFTLNNLYYSTNLTTKDVREIEIGLLVEDVVEILAEIAGTVGIAQWLG